MQLFKLTFCLVLYNVSIAVKANPGALRDDLAVGYYWREYSRDIPHDALPGGVDKRGKITYIGQTAHNGCENQIILTGQIQEAEQKMIYEWGYRKNMATTQIRILCTHHPEHFRWIKTTPQDIKNLTNVHLISGGIEKNYAVYIGRVFSDEEIAIGKVLVTNDPNFLGLYTVMNNNYFHEKKSFEVLAYDPNIPRNASHQTMRLKSSSSSNTNIAWQPILALLCLRTLYFSFLQKT